MEFYIAYCIQFKGINVRTPSYTSTSQPQATTTTSLPQGTTRFPLTFSLVDIEDTFILPVFRSIILLRSCSICCCSYNSCFFYVLVFVVDDVDCNDDGDAGDDDYDDYNDDGDAGDEDYDDDDGDDCDYVVYFIKSEK